MAGSRTLKLSILADVADLTKKLGDGSKDVQSFGDKVSEYGKKAAVAFVAAAGAIAAASVEMVKNAAEDEAAQRKLALTLENTSNATRDQIAAVEDYITKVSLSKGITDDQLRPAFERLNRSTKDITESQKLLNLSLDIASGTGKPLEAVVAALSKAYDGNSASLGRLGLGVDSSILKSKDFDKITSALRQNFQGFSDQEANTFEGKLRRLQIAFDEGKETIGSYILTAITPLVEVVVNKIIPAISDFTNNLGEKLSPVIKIFRPVLEGLTSAFNDIKDSFVENKDKLQPFYDLIKAVAKFVVDVLAPVIGEVLGGAFKAFGKVISGLIDTFANIVDFFQNVYDKIKKIIDYLKNNPVSKFLGASYSSGGDSAAIVNASYSSGGDISVPSVDRSIFKMTPAQQAEYERLKAETAAIRAKIAARAAGEIFGSGTTINVNGAIDPISTARQISQILGIEATTSGSFTNLGYSYV